MMKPFFVSPTVMAGDPTIWLISCVVLYALQQLIVLPIRSIKITFLRSIFGVSWVLSALHVCLESKRKEPALC